MNLPQPGAGYDRQNEAETRSRLERADKANLKAGQDIEMGPASLVLQSPDGSRFAITVDNAGALSTTAL